MSYKIAPLTEVRIPNYFDNYVKMHIVRAIYKWKTRGPLRRKLIWKARKMRYGNKGSKI